MIEANVTGRLDRRRLLRRQAFQDPLDSHINRDMRLHRRVFATDSLVHLFPILRLAVPVAVEAGRALAASLRRAFFAAVLTAALRHRLRGCAFVRRLRRRPLRRVFSVRRGLQKCGYYVVYWKLESLSFTLSRY